MSAIPRMNESETQFFESGGQEVEASLLDPAPVVGLPEEHFVPESKPAPTKSATAPEQPRGPIRAAASPAGGAGGEEAAAGPHQPRARQHAGQHQELQQ